MSFEDHRSPDMEEMPNGFDAPELLEFVTISPEDVYEEASPTTSHLGEVAVANVVTVTENRVNRTTSFLSLAYGAEDAESIEQGDTAAIALQLPTLALTIGSAIIPRFRGQLPGHADRLNKYLDGMTTSEIAKEEGRSKSGVESSRVYLAQKIKAHYPLNELVSKSKNMTEGEIKIIGDPVSEPVKASSQDKAPGGASISINGRKANARERASAKNGAYDKLDLSQLESMGKRDEMAKQMLVSHYVSRGEVLNINALHESPGLCRVLLRTIQRLGKKLKADEVDSMIRVLIRNEEPRDTVDLRRAERAQKKLYQKLSSAGYFIPQQFSANQKARA